MWWWMLLIPILTKLIEWLLSANRLTLDQRIKVDHALYLLHRAEDRGVQLGCVRGGRVP